MTRVLLTIEQKRLNRIICNAKYRAANKEKIREIGKRYHRTPAGRKTNRLSNFRSSGMICPDDNWDIFYERLINTKNCELCNVELTSGGYNTRTTRCVDHSHITGIFRNIVCNNCNIRLPRGT